MACLRSRTMNPSAATNGAMTLTTLGGSNAYSSGLDSQTVGKIASTAKTYVLCHFHQSCASDTSFIPAAPTERNNGECAACRKRM